MAYLYFADFLFIIICSFVLGTDVVVQRLVCLQNFVYIIMSSIFVCINMLIRVLTPPGKS